ncbi:unnamed protein product [Paramecium primaurelia]|uniref:USP domain-containing protein n=1 Tax=Paramecium primaurelia TaxID=5886 RepID=A0A8S1PQU1_PARPR|nr:unnamed protein product [Paramecium primaurelia]
MLDAQQKDQISQLMDITNRSKVLIISILMYFNWDQEKSMDFILNAGEFLSEDLIPESRRQAAEILLRQEEQEQRKLNQSQNNNQGNFQKQKSEISQSQINNFYNIQTTNDGIDKPDWIQTKNKRISQIKEYMQQLENQEWENMQIIKERLQFIQNSQNKQQNDQIQVRMHKCLIGMNNNEVTGYFNCIYQLFFQNPELVESILSLSNIFNKEDQNSQYLNELQFLFGSFILSNNSFVKDSNIYQIANRLNKMIIGDDQINFAQQYETHIDIITKCFQEISKQNQVSIFEQTFQSFINQKKSGQKSLSLKLEQEDRSLHLSLLKQIENLSSLKQQQTCKTYWTFEINRSGSKNQELKNNQNNLDYWFTKKIDLEILFSTVRADKILQIFEQNLNDENIKEIKKLQQIINSLHIVISLLEIKDLIQKETLQNLKIEKETLEKQLLTYYPFNMNIISKDDSQSSKYSYCLQATVIQIQQDNIQLFYIYIYNFYEELWYRIFDKEITVVNEDIVINDTRKNGYLLIYIHQSQISRLKGYQQTISEITRKITINQGDISQELIQRYPILNGLSTNHIEMIQNSNREIIKILNEQLNNEFNY